MRLYAQTKHKKETDFRLIPYNIILSYYAMTITLFKLCCATLLCYVILFDCRLSDVKREHLRAERFAV